jgi:two-component system chemotaxis response regulator CheY
MVKFLLIDDSPTIRLNVKASILKLNKAALIVEAADVRQAVSEFRTERPDVVFLDMMLGKEKGNDVLSLMLKENPGARIVLLTGLPREHAEVVDAISNGAFGYLQKPVRGDAIRKILSEIDEEGGRSVRMK